MAYRRKEPTQIGRGTITQIKKRVMVRAGIPYIPTLRS
jgi:hypothetical protein